MKAKIVLHASLTDLLRWRSEPAVLGSYGPVITEVAERVITHHLDNPDADYLVVVTHPITGRPLQIHPVQPRLFRGRLRDVVDVVNPHCTWVTSCARPAPSCIGDHTTDYARGGPTAQGNGSPLCSSHNREKTTNGWQQDQPSPGHFTWTSPYGHQYHIHPETQTDTDPDPPPY